MGGRRFTGVIPHGAEASAGWRRKQLRLKRSDECLALTPVSRVHPASFCIGQGQIRIGHQLAWNRSPTDRCMTESCQCFSMNACMKSDQAVTDRAVAQYRSARNQKPGGRNLCGGMVQLHPAHIMVGVVLHTLCEDGHSRRPVVSPPSSRPPPTAPADEAHRGLAAGMFPGAAADAAGRDLTLRDGAQTPAPSTGGGALVTPRPSN